MSDQSPETAAQPEGQPVDASLEQGQAATPEFITRQDVEKLLQDYRKEIAEESWRTVQSYTDKRNARMQAKLDEMERIFKAQEAAGMTIPPEVRRKMREDAVKELDSSPDDQAQPSPAQERPQDKGQPPQAQMPPEAYQADAILAAAKVPYDAPELAEFEGLDASQIVDKAWEIAGKYRQEQTSPQRTTNPTARMPAVGAVAPAAGNQLEQLRQRLNNMHPTNPEYIKLHRQFEDLLRKSTR